MYLKNVLKFFLVGATFLSAVSPDFLMAMAPLPEDEVVDFSPQTAISHKDPSIGGDQELMRATEAFRSLLPGASLPSDDLLRPAIQSILEPYKRKLKQAHREIEDLNKRLFSPEKGAVSAKVSNQALRAQRRGSEKQ